jgi:hypothetical protein
MVFSQGPSRFLIAVPRNFTARRVPFHWLMNADDFNELSESEKRHFYKCSRCGEMVDRRQLDDVLFHETDHKPRPDIQYSGSSQNRRMNAQCSTHVYKVHPAHGSAGFDPNQFDAVAGGRLYSAKRIASRKTQQLLARIAVMSSRRYSITERRES